MLNPPDLWIREPVPELRIVDDELWAAVQARKDQLSALPSTHGSAPKRLLSRLMMRRVRLHDGSGRRQIRVQPRA